MVEVFTDKPPCIKIGNQDVQVVEPRVAEIFFNKNFCATEVDQFRTKEKHDSREKNIWINEQVSTPTADRKVSFGGGGKVELGEPSKGEKMYFGLPKVLQKKFGIKKEELSDYVAAVPLYGSSGEIVVRYYAVSPLLGRDDFEQWPGVNSLADAGAYSQRYDINSANQLPKIKSEEDIGGSFFGEGTAGKNLGLALIHLPTAKERKKTLTTRLPVKFISLENYPNGVIHSINQNNSTDYYRRFILPNALTRMAGLTANKTTNAPGQDQGFGNTVTSGALADIAFVGAFAKTEVLKAVVGGALDAVGINMEFAEKMGIKEGDQMNVEIKVGSQVINITKIT